MRIRYYGHIGEPTGYGRAAMDLCMALQRTGIQLEIRPLAKPERVRLPDAFLPLARDIGYWTDAAPGVNVLIVHTMPGDCRRVLETIGVTTGRMARTIRCVAYTTCETAWVPPEIKSSLFSTFDDVWVPSAAAARAMGTFTRVLPHCFAASARARPAAAASLAERPYRFYSIGAWSERKNPLGLLKAYDLAFTCDDPVELVLHAADLDYSDPRLARGGRLPLVRLSSGWRSDAEVAAMHVDNDCFVSASHGEAWNLPAFDAMLAGRHVIAPAGQGSDEFLKDSTATRYLTGKTKYPTGSRWDANARAPDLDDLAKAMRSRAACLCRDLTLYYDPAERFGYDAVGKLVLRYLDTPGVAT